MSPTGCACNLSSIPSRPEPYLRAKLALGDSWLRGKWPCGWGRAQESARTFRWPGRWVSVPPFGMVCSRSRGKHKPPAARLSGTWSSPHVPEQALHRMVVLGKTGEAYPVPLAVAGEVSAFRDTRQHCPSAGWRGLCRLWECGGRVGWRATAQPREFPSPTVAGGPGSSEELPSAVEFLMKDWQLRQVLKQ